MRYALPWTILLVMIYSIRISPTRRRFTHIIKNHINAEADSQEEQTVKMSAIDSFDTGSHRRNISTGKHPLVVSFK